MKDRDYKLISITVKELKEGFRRLSKLRPCVTIFGATYISKTDLYYIKAMELGRKLGDLGYTIVTGAGPGIMEAVNHGARLSKSKSVGLNIELPNQQKPNRYLDVLINFKYFYSRKVIFLRYASAVIVFPGGYGTSDEFFEVIALIQTGKIPQIPIYLFGESYWSGLYMWIKEKMLGEGKITEKDLFVFKITDSIDKIVGELKKLKEEL